MPTVHRRSAGADIGDARHRARCQPNSTGIKNYNAAGLLGSYTLNIGARTPVASGVDNCLRFAKERGTGYQLVTGAEPVCGTLIPGINNSGA